jgi:AT hook motif
MQAEEAASPLVPTTATAAAAAAAAQPPPTEAVVAAATAATLATSAAALYPQQPYQCSPGLLPPACFWPPRDALVSLFHLFNNEQLEYEMEVERQRRGLPNHGSKNINKWMLVSTHEKKLQHVTQAYEAKLLMLQHQLKHHQQQQQQQHQGQDASSHVAAAAAIDEAVKLHQQQQQQQQQQAYVDTHVTPTKKRGRPRKTPIVHQENDSILYPKAAAAAVEVHDDGTETNNNDAAATSANKRGRPRKDQDIVDLIAAAAAQHVQRSSSSSKKHPSAAASSSSNKKKTTTPTGSSSSNTKLSPATLATMTLRPAFKNVADVLLVGQQKSPPIKLQLAAANNESTNGPLTKKRGRPRKNPIVDDDNHDSPAFTSIDSTAAVGASGRASSSGKKKTGPREKRSATSIATGADILPAGEQKGPIRLQLY